MHPMRSMWVVPLALCIFPSLALTAAQSKATKNKPTASPATQTFTADASRWSGAPLVKDKFGVYQTPLRSLDVILRSAPFLAETQVRDIRYEMGIGKRGALAWDQISGTAGHPHYDFTNFDALVNSWSTKGIKPLFAFTYCPPPLQPAGALDAWKRLPQSLPAWQDINRAYASRLRDQLHVEGSWVEEWNEPDLGEHGTKVFFTGTPEQYGSIFAYGARGIHAGDQDARVGGPAVAYDSAYLDQSGLLASPETDFVSIHAYANYAVQLRNLRSRVLNRPDLPLILSEYASYSAFGLRAPISRHEAAAAFFADVNGLLKFQDTPKVYWAQWVDDELGLLTNDLHRKAIYNAYLIYQMVLPADRVEVTSSSGIATGAMAGADEHTAALVVWNNGSKSRRVKLRLTSLPFGRGTVRQWFIDKDHASFLDNAPEKLTAGGDWSGLLRGKTAQWRGAIQPRSVVVLQASDDSGQSLLSPHPIGTFVRSYYWYRDRTHDSYADFDPRTSIARVGMGTGNHALAQIGNVYDNPHDKLQIQIKKQGRFASETENSMFGLRIDFRNRIGTYNRSVLYCDELCDSGRTEVLPWGEKTARPEDVIREAGMNSGGAFIVNLTSVAPEDWDRRIIITPILQDARAGASVRILIKPLP